jgi:hypothetical protein
MVPAFGTFQRISLLRWFRFSCCKLSVSPKEIHDRDSRDFEDRLLFFRRGEGIRETQPPLEGKGANHKRRSVAFRDQRGTNTKLLISFTISG